MCHSCGDCYYLRQKIPSFYSVPTATQVWMAQNQHYPWSQISPAFLPWNIHTTTAFSIPYGSTSCELCFFKISIVHHKCNQNIVLKCIISRSKPLNQCFFHYVLDYKLRITTNRANSLSNKCVQFFFTCSSSCQKIILLCWDISDDTVSKYIFAFCHFYLLCECQNVVLIWRIIFYMRTDRTKINSKFQDIMSSQLRVWLLPAQGMYRLQKQRRPLFISENWDPWVGGRRRFSSPFKSSPVLHKSYFEVMFTFLDCIRFSSRDIWVLSVYFWLCLRMFILFNVGDLNSWQGTW